MNGFKTSRIISSFCFHHFTWNFNINRLKVLPHISCQLYQCWIACKCLEFMSSLFNEAEITNIHGNLWMQFVSLSLIFLFLILSHTHSKICDYRNIYVADSPYTYYKLFQEYNGSFDHFQLRIATHISWHKACYCLLNENKINDKHLKQKSQHLRFFWNSRWAGKFA